MRYLLVLLLIYSTPCLAITEVGQGTGGSGGTQFDATANSVAGFDGSADTTTYGAGDSLPFAIDTILPDTAPTEEGQLTLDASNNSLRFMTGGTIYTLAGTGGVTTYSLTVDMVDGNGTDLFTYDSTDYTTDQTFSGLTADATFTVTADTDREVSCTGTGLTDNTGGSYTANTDTASVTAACTYSDAVSCTPSSLIHQTVTDDYTRPVLTTGSTIGQSFTISTETTLAKISLDMSNFEDAVFTLRVGTGADLTTYTEEITGEYTGTDAQAVEFVSSSNPTLTAGTWYIGVRVVSGTDVDGWLRGSNVATNYTGGQTISGDGGTTDWNMDSTYDYDLGFEVHECQ
jgi:hypothetical protein